MARSQVVPKKGRASTSAKKRTAGSRKSSQAGKARRPATRQRRQAAAGGGKGRAKQARQPRIQPEAEQAPSDGRRTDEPLGFEGTDEDSGGVAARTEDRPARHGGPAAAQEPAEPGPKPTERRQRAGTADEERSRARRAGLGFRDE